jgi:hypothetical protein
LRLRVFAISVFTHSLAMLRRQDQQLPPRVISVRFSFPESCSSAPLAKKAVLGTARDIFVLDSAFVLIEGHPQLELLRPKWASPRQGYKEWPSLTIEGASCGIREVGRPRHPPAD